MRYTTDSIEQFALKNFNQIMVNNIIKACIVEMMSAEEDNHLFVNAPGYDQISEDGTRTEVKYTNTVLKNGCLRIQNLVTKKGKADKFKIVDGINDRKFIVPADTFFKKANLTKCGMFFWSSTYNQSDKLQRDNTDLLLKYEV